MDHEHGLSTSTTDLLAADGGVIHVRPIAPDDRSRHMRFIDALSPDSRTMRFMGPRRSLTAEETDHFCCVDYVDRMALVALLEDEIIAIARYDRTDEQTAEVAFAVADHYQGRGIATVLLERLAELARMHGIEQFTAEMLAANFRMAQVFRDAGFTMTSHYESGGSIHVELDLALTDRARDAIAERHHRSAVAAMDAILGPADTPSDPP